MLFFTMISGIMAVSSGMLLVFGPWYITIHSLGYAFSALYFFVYVCVSILTSSFLGALLDRFGGMFGLRVASIMRLMLLMAIAAAEYMFHLPIAYAAPALALAASGPDSIYRMSVGVFLKERISNEMMAKAIGNTQASRQIGYVLGTSLAGSLLAFRNGINIFILVIFIIALLTAVFAFSVEKIASERAYVDVVEPKISFASQFQFILAEMAKYDLLTLFFGVLILTTIGFLLPMNVAPLMIKVKGMTVLQLGVVETCFSVGTFLGSIFYSRIVNKITTLISLFLTACSLVALIFIPNLYIDFAFFLLGFMLNATIPLSADFARTCPIQIVGRVGGMLSLLSSMSAALVLGASSIEGFSNPKVMYGSLSVAIVIVTGALLLDSERKSRIKEISSI